MKAAEVNGICFSLFSRSNYSSVEFNYYLFCLFKMLLNVGKQLFV